MAERKGFKGKYNDFLNWWRNNNIEDVLRGGEDITVVVGKPPPPKTKEKSLSKSESAFEKLLGKPSISEAGGSGEGEDSSADIEMPSIPPELEENNIQPPKWFLQKLKSILKDNTLHRKGTNKLYGDLDFKHLYKISTTNKVFSRKEIIDKKTYNIALVVDCSGSMVNRDKSIIAGKSASLLVSDLQKLSNLMVMGFNRDQYIYKHFNTQIKEKELFKTIEKTIVNECHSSNASGNHDYMALRVAYRELLKQRGQKIIIVLSDGEPSCSGCAYEGCEKGNRGEQEKKLIEEAKYIEQQYIPILSIGILDISVKEFYKNYKIINNPNEIFGTIVELLGSSVKRLPIKC